MTCPWKTYDAIVLVLEQLAQFGMPTRRRMLTEFDAMLWRAVRALPSECERSLMTLIRRALDESPTPAKAMSLVTFLVLDAVDLDLAWRKAVYAALVASYPEPESAAVKSALAWIRALAAAREDRLALH